MKKKIYKDTVLYLLLIFPIIIIAKYYQFNMLNSNAFGIITRLIRWLHTEIIPSDPSYAFPLQFYRNLKFLPFQTALEWGIFWSLVMNFIFFIIFLRKEKKYTIEEYIFIYASMFILDVFVFNINKDLVQCLIFLIVYFIARKKISKNKKILLSSLTLIIESICFRPYYIFGAATIVISYFVLNKFIDTRKSNNIIKVLFLILILMFTMIYVTQYIKPDSYIELLERRDTLDEDIEAITVIIDWLPGDGYFNYCINYIINLFRICFPVELLKIGAKYIPFFIYQIYLTINMIKTLNNVNKKNIVNISIVLGYWLMLFASESDFGTLVRHQAILLPFYLEIIRNNLMLKKGVKTKYE